MTRQPDPDFLALVDTHQETLLRAGCLLTGDWDRAEDLLRDTLSWALGSWDTLRGHGLGPLRARQRLVAAYLISQPGPTDDPDDDNGVEDQELDPEEQGVLTRPVLAALARLDPADRAIVVARYYLGLSSAEIAEILGRDAEDVADSAVAALRDVGWPG